jgi:predicted small lipoprotein YifL
MAVKRTMLLVLGLVALAGCGGQQQGPRDVPAAEQEGEESVTLDVGGATTPPIRGLIGERQRLGLTGAQAVTLDSIAVVLAAANDSLRSSVREAWEGDQPGRAGAMWERTGPALLQIAHNNRAAGLLVQNTLTEAQRAIACEMEAEQRARQPERFRRPPPGIGGFGARRAEIADSVALRRALEGWPWCPPAPLPPRRR